MRRFLAAMAFPVLMAGCAGTDNRPEPTTLQDITLAFKLAPVWRAEVERAEVYRFVPALSGQEVFVASVDGQVNVFDLQKGVYQRHWTVPGNLAGGVAASQNMIVLGGRKGEVWAYQPDGKLLWKAAVSSEVVSPPVIAQDKVLVRGGDGHITALSLQDGSQRWSFARTLPPLIIRNYSAMTLADGVVYAGLPGGRLLALQVADGSVLWEAQVAQAQGSSELERVVDIVSPPVVDQGQICVVAFQGRVACYTASSGNLLWAREASSTVGLALDHHQLYLVGDDGVVSAHERDTGKQLWRQDKLYGRQLGQPGLFGRYIAVGDYAGYLHLLNPGDGAFVSRTATGRHALKVMPRAIDEKLLVQTEYGVVTLFGLR